MRINWKGIGPALSTPVHENGLLDEEGLRSEVRFNIEKGAHLLAVGLMSGEFWKFTDEERMRAIRIVVEETNREVPVLAGVSHSGVEPAISLAKYAKDVGADGIIVLPSYFPDRDKVKLSLYEYYATIATRVDLPIMIQDCEGVGPYMCPTVYGRLAKEFSNIVSVKIEGPRAFEKIVETKGLMGDELAIFGGMAARNMVEELRIGVSGNVPDACLTDVLVEIYENFSAGDTKKAEEIFGNYKLWLDFLTLHPYQNYETEKETLRLRGVIKSSYMRLPRGPLLSEQDKAGLKHVLEEMNLA